MRILLLSNMYPSAERPEFGVFIKRLEEALRERGNVVDVAVIDDARAGALRTPGKYVSLAWRARKLARRSKPDVVYAHYLVPTGVIAGLTRVPFVITAHGQDVENARKVRALRSATGWVLRRAGAVICVSRYLAERLTEEPRRLEVIDCGVDTQLLTPAERPPGEGPRFLFVGSLTPRKNVGRLMEAFVRLDEGSLTIVGAGPLEEELRAAAPPGVTFLGRVSSERLAEELARADVLCQPSLVEPQGQALLEAMARGRPVVATHVGGPPEFVPPEGGELVDPLDVRSIASGMRRAARLPVPNPAAIEAARAHDVRVQAEKIEQVLRSVCCGGDGPARRPPP